MIRLFYLVLLVLFSFGTWHYVVTARNPLDMAVGFVLAVAAGVALFGLIEG